jgi:hypothetical protein
MEAGTDWDTFYRVIQERWFTFSHLIVSKEDVT